MLQLQNTQCYEQDISDKTLKDLMGHPCIYCKVLDKFFIDTSNLLSGISSHYVDIHHSLLTDQPCEDQMDDVSY